ncbi:MAG TPA: SDR family oxidoreductase [Pirellulales bacterium]|nr:SDR family oxidoreductase [Pirellulales bacterium]
MSKRSIHGSRVLITGASSGIGRALALELARQGAKLVLNARRLDRLDELAAEIATLGTEAAPLAGDVTLAGVRHAALEAAQARFGGLDALVNNAGIGAWGRFEEAAPDRLRRIMEVNFFATVEMTREALPMLRRGRDPIVVNVASILGHRAIPRSSEYCASKFAVRGFSESLRAELAGQGIGVLVVSPGTTESEFVAGLIERKSEMAWPEQPAVPAAVVAAQTVRAMRLGLREIIPNRRGRLLIWLNRLAPRWVDRWMERYG